MLTTLPAGVGRLVSMLKLICSRTCAVLAASIAMLVPVAAADAATFAVLTDDATLLTGDTATPAVAGGAVAITGVPPTEYMAALESLPDGRLLLLTHQGGDLLRLYTLNPATAAATLLTTVPASGSTGAYGIDFNPTANRLRVVNDLGANLRFDPVTGNLFATDTALSGTGVARHRL